MKHKILTAANLRALDEKISYHLANGWKLYGFTQDGSDAYYQQVIYEEQGK